MRKNSFITPRGIFLLLRGKRSVLFSFAIGTCLLASCSRGADCDEEFKSTVSNTQLESPVLESTNFATKVNSDGSESVQVTWPLVYGAIGYECEVQNVDDPSNPKVVFEKDTIDGTNFLFKKVDDTNYKVSVRALGNQKLNNKDAETATVYAYSTLVPAQTIPAGSDIVAFVNANIIDTDTEQAFELEAGASYEINEPLDFGEKQVTFRGNKINRATITFGEKGVIRTGKGLKVKFINFDCTAATSMGVIECSEAPSSNIIGPKNNAYYMQNPIILQECMFKNVHRCLFGVGHCIWAIEDFRIDNCIVQLDCDGTKGSNDAIICAYSKDFYFEGGQQWRGSIKNITVKNSTIYNLKTNGKNRFIRFASNSLSHVFPTDDGFARIENCTFSKVYDNKEFANNTPNKAQYKIYFNNNICYDVFRLQKFIQGNCTKDVDMEKNTIWGVKNAVDSTDKSKYATEEDPLFEGDVLQELDLTQPNGGVNFKANGAISSKIGDPRWRE